MVMNTTRIFDFDNENIVILLKFYDYTHFDSRQCKAMFVLILTVSLIIAIFNSS